MSLGENGQWIHCDGEGCSAAVPVPVALCTRATGECSEPHTIHGWLFVVSEGKASHYCPQCAPAHLSTLSLPAKK